MVDIADPVVEDSASKSSVWDVLPGLTWTLSGAPGGGCGHSAGHVSRSRDADAVASGEAAGVPHPA